MTRQILKMVDPPENWGTLILSRSFTLVLLIYHSCIIHLDHPQVCIYLFKASYLANADSASDSTLFLSLLNTSHNSVSHATTTSPQSIVLFSYPNSYTFFDHPLWHPPWPFFPQFAPFPTFPFYIINCLLPHAEWTLEQDGPPAIKILSTLHSASSSSLWLW